MGGERTSAEGLLREALRDPSRRLLQSIAEIGFADLGDCSRAMTAAVEIASLPDVSASEIETGVERHLRVTNAIFVEVDETGPEQLPGVRDYGWFMSVLGITASVHRPDLAPLVNRVVDCSRHLRSTRARTSRS